VPQRQNPALPYLVVKLKTTPDVVPTALDATTWK
jgi:hypothetical protein